MRFYTRRVGVPQVQVQETRSRPTSLTHTTLKSYPKDFPTCISVCAGWVFPKYDHVAVGTGTVINKTSIKQYQQVRSWLSVLLRSHVRWVVLVDVVY